MRLFRNATVFAAELPAIDELRQHVEACQFVEVLPSHLSSIGFVPHPTTAELVTPIEGGYLLHIRRDEKVMPRQAVQQAQDKAVKARQEELGRELDGDEVKDLRERVFAQLVETALIKPGFLTAYYHVERGYLILPTTSKGDAQAVIRLLIKAIGQVRTQTIHVDSVKNGLTTRLRSYLDLGVDTFDGFKLGNVCHLKGEKGSAKFDLGDLDMAKRALGEALDNRMEVVAMELEHGSVGFKLTHDFKIRAIDFASVELSPEQQDAQDQEREGWDGVQLFRHEAAVQLLLLCGLVDALCALFGYERPAEVPLSEEVADGALDDDPLYEEAVEFVRKSKRASISALQRKLKVGYNRAARMIEQMEAAGVIKPMDANGFREVVAADD